jgi:hypothetical protein
MMETLSIDRLITVVTASLVGPSSHSSTNQLPAVAAEMKKTTCFQFPNNRLKEGTQAGHFIDPLA